MNYANQGVLFYVYFGLKILFEKKVTYKVLLLKLNLINQVF